VQFRTGRQKEEFACYEAELNGIRSSTGDSSKKEIYDAPSTANWCVYVTKCNKNVTRAPAEHNSGS